MKIKQGASIIGMQPQIALALVIVDQILQQYGEQVLITSGTAGDPHHKNSKHRHGFAVDIRSKIIADSGVKNDILADFRTALGDEYYCQISNPGEDNECFHIQYNGVQS